MEAERYHRICLWIDQACPRRSGSCIYSDRYIVKVQLWAVLHDRPTSWACDPRNWPDERDRTAAMPMGDPPSQSTMSRRLRTVGVLQLLERTQVLVAERFVDDPAVGPGPLKAIDSKPLRVGKHTKDRDARRGRGAGEMANGYKLHTLRGGRGGRAVLAWTLTGMNVNDQVPARQCLLPAAAATPGGGYGYVAADNGYDANPVHLAAAAANHQLVAPPRKSNAGVRDVRRNTPQRIRALDMCHSPLRAAGLRESFGQSLLRQRKEIERGFGHLAMLGLYAPPPWVRRPHRVAYWVAAKLVIHLDRLLEIEGVAP